MDYRVLKSLVGKLNPTCRNGLESAAGLCLARTNYEVEIEHWLLKLAEAPNTDLAAILRYFEIDNSRLIRELTRVVDHLKTGNSRSPALSPNLVKLVREAWIVASIEFGAFQVRSGHLLSALISEDGLARVAREASRQFENISPEAIRKDLADITAGTEEARSAAAVPVAVGPAERPMGAAGAAAGTKTLDQFTIDLTERARLGQIDPVLGRDAEIRQVVDILTRRRQNNPILTGEAGVGKTAVAEGFALRIAAGDVPPPLKDVAIRTLDLGLLQAGAGIKGEFENRLKSVIEEVKASSRPIILFIDEAHTMIGAGGQAGQGDAANLLKPALARGELRTIAATTWAEYKKYFEKDAALARRFQVVKVEEPSERVGIEMMRGLVATLERHHNIRILEEAVTDAVKLSHRYISGRQLPDKAVSLLDTASARVAISHSATPPAVEDCRRRIEQLAISLEILQRESLAGAKNADRIAEVTEAREAARRQLESLEARWKQEAELVGRLRRVREQLEAKPPAGDQGRGGQEPRQPAAAEPAAESADATELAAQRPEELRKEFQQLSRQLAQLQGDAPLMHVCVDSQAIAEVVSGWTGIPVGRMVTDEIRTVLALKEQMERRVVGQSHALEAIAQRIRTSRANLTDPRRPIGVFLLVGPSGVGKTETAITLAELLYGGDQNMTVINMSEFKEEHKVSLLMGSPPGYVGYGEGGVLTEAVRRRPYSVVLLDEMEKAHPGVQDIFYQVFDKGTLRDGEGRDIDFKNTVILMTSNAATDLIVKLCADPETCPGAEALAEALHPELVKTFKPAFLGRVTILPYFPLGDEVLRRIVELQLDRIARRISESHRARLAYDPELVAAIAGRCTEVESGARNVDHILTRTLLPDLASEFLARMTGGEPISEVRVSMGDGGRFRYEFS
ncbi:MAG: type VI secretion system ATPase TssH [Thermoguttaceae bacterium]|nr:type VI secretion system ATPase TssH [Thermoguttaceae bacterium]MDI9442770.1 type VI secretion system ATPase TssH [Planctomycetota bacterium]